MAWSSSVTSPAAVRRRVVPPSPIESRFDRRLSKIVVHATAVFYEKGYEQVSDLVRQIFALRGHQSEILRPEIAEHGYVLS